MLGFYDSWLAIALLAVGFVRQRWVVLLACVLAPWIDERFVIGLPLALCVRRIWSEDTTQSRWVWLKREALMPVILAIGYSVLRLLLGGAGGSQSIAQYLNQFVFSKRLAPSQRILGAWEGLRVGWLLVVAAMVRSWRLRKRGMQSEAILLVAGVVLTGLVGLLSALDMSRSMVLILPVVPLGWMTVAHTGWWRRFYVAPVLAATALFLPARHVSGEISIPVENLWSPPTPLAAAHYSLAKTLATMPDRQAEALAHFAEALRLKPDFAIAHNELANVLVTMPDRRAEALAHYAEAVRIDPALVAPRINLANALAQQPDRLQDALEEYAIVCKQHPDNWEAHYCLANTLATIPGRTADALAEYSAALRLRPDYAEAHASFARFLAQQPGRLGDAVIHFQAAVDLAPDIPRNHYNLALALANYPDRVSEAIAQFQAVIRLDPHDVEARNNLAVIYANAGQTELARELWVDALKANPNFEPARRNLILLDQGLARRQPLHD
jgi:tetratricopeptide (TPR) repeat protein